MTMTKETSTAARAAVAQEKARAAVIKAAHGISPEVDDFRRELAAALRHEAGTRTRLDALAHKACRHMAACLDPSLCQMLVEGLRKDCAPAIRRAVEKALPLLCGGARLGVHKGKPALVACPEDSLLRITAEGVERVEVPDLARTRAQMEALESASIWTLKVVKETAGVTPAAILRQASRLCKHLQSRDLWQSLPQGKDAVEALEALHAALEGTVHAVPVAQEVTPSAARQTVRQ